MSYSPQGHQEYNTTEGLSTCMYIMFPTVPGTGYELIDVDRDHYH